MVSAKWSQSGHQEVVNLGFLLVSQILRKLQQKPDLKLSKPLNINRRPPPTHVLTLGAAEAYIGAICYI